MMLSFLERKDGGGDLYSESAPSPDVLLPFLALSLPPSLLSFIPLVLPAPAIISRCSGRVPSGSSNASRSKSFAASLMAFSGVTPARFAPRPGKEGWREGGRKGRDEISE